MWNSGFGVKAILGLGFGILGTGWQDSSWTAIMAQIPNYTLLTGTGFRQRVALRAWGAGAQVECQCLNPEAQHGPDAAHSNCDILGPTCLNRSHKQRCI